MEASKDPAQPRIWHLVGRVSQFPDIGDDEKGCQVLSGCKTLSIPKTDVQEQSQGNRFSDLGDQVLVFKYKGFLHAIDNQCPHSAFPLKQGNVFDIEDLGAGIKCFRHGWKFDLFTGKGDRGSHKLPLWDIELRDPCVSEIDEKLSSTDKEVWVRRPPQS
ncbi:uncharacterized protein N7469_002688 [Penicillium citrinum]|uniref:Rieske domain-containing protein n=2 Tax=Penicillium TaxID=5073 RepID=A0A9W9PB05_PENCI|nr:uncharacterized protein N7469_002688 [Penicillium citrinum]KAJ5241097.1 hypothetical protein N7469_002688 [Penicillium citrinum]KAJ5586094.1 hypothetical protein N7450_005881 [Penicillium hetheringtonii]